MTALIDSKIKINLIQQKFALQWNLTSIDVVLSRSEFFDEKIRYCYDVYNFEYHLIDFWNQYRKCIILFYAVDYINFDVILSMSMLSQQEITMNSKTQNWRFKIRINNFEIFESKVFDETLTNQNQVFVLICADVTQTQFDKSERKISNQLRKFENQFDNDKIDILSKQKKSRYKFNKKQKIIIHVFVQFVTKKINEISTLHRKCFNQKLNSIFNFIRRCFDIFCF